MGRGKLKVYDMNIADSPPKPKPSPRKTFSCSLLRGCKDAGGPTAAEDPWPRFHELFAEPAVRNAKDGLAWVPATFGEEPNGKGNLRHDGNVTAVTAVV